jgi:hypothetical protein
MAAPLRLSGRHRIVVDGDRPGEETLDNAALRNAPTPAARQ